MSANLYMLYILSQNRFQAVVLAYTCHAGFGDATTRALEAKAFRAFAYICAGAMKYNPTPNRGEGPYGQIYCINGLLQVSISHLWCPETNGLCCPAIQASFTECVSASSAQLALYY